MKKFSIILALILCAGLAVYVTSAIAQNEPGTAGRGYGYGQNWNYCPWCGNYVGPPSGYTMGPGMMGQGYNYGMGPGMMGPGYGYGRGGGRGMMGPGYGYGRGSQYTPQYMQPQKPLDKDDARQEVENYLKSTRNPNLKVGDVQEKDDAFEISVLTKDGSLADKIMIDKNTGQMYPGY